MPLVAHSHLPTFERLRQEGEDVINVQQANEQTRCALHIGLLNMMPDAALEATERQFFRLVGACHQATQFHLHPFTIDGLARCEQAQAHIDEHYESFAEIKGHGLDALIISGANVAGHALAQEDFWQPLTEVFSWAYDNVTSILCSCLATHAIMQYRYGLTRMPLDKKRWGVFAHHIVDKTHPLVVEMNSRFDVPHSRFNEIFRADMERNGLHVLVQSQQAGVHLAVSEDGFRIVFFQGHPEYDDVSLLKEYKREVMRFYRGEVAQYPPLPDNYFCDEAKILLAEYEQTVKWSKNNFQALKDFPEAHIRPYIDNTWRDSAKTVFNNWLNQIHHMKGDGTI